MWRSYAFPLPSSSCKLAQPRCHRSRGRTNTDRLPDQQRMAQAPTHLPRRWTGPCCRARDGGPRRAGPVADGASDADCAGRASYSRGRRGRGDRRCPFHLLNLSRISSSSTRDALSNGTWRCVWSAQRAADHDRGFAPAYQLEMIGAISGDVMGSINLRVGHTQHLRLYLGHLGFGVLEPFRGNHLALLPMRYDTGRPRAVIRLRISQLRTTSLLCPARPSDCCS